MKLQHIAIQVLKQLHEVFEQVHDTDYATPLPILHGASVGAHLRHILEFFLCLEAGLVTGTVNYDQRERDKSIETQRSKALTTIQRISGFIANDPDSKALKLEVDYGTQEQEAIALIATDYARELAYNIEHAIHHMAIIKIGITQTMPHISLPSHFGIASSTVRHKAQENTGAVQPQA